MEFDFYPIDWKPQMGFGWAICDPHMYFILLVQMFSIITCHHLKIRCFHSKIWLCIIIIFQMFRRSWMV